MIEWYRNELAAQPHLALMHSLYQCLPDDHFDPNAQSTCRQSLSRGKLRYLVTERGKDPLGTVLTTILYSVSFLTRITPINITCETWLAFSLSSSSSVSAESSLLNTFVCEKPLF